MPFINSVSPIKLFEYMACRLPVVSLKWKSLEEIASPAFLAETEQDFLKKIDKALKTTDEFKDACIRFAAENSWAKRFELVKNLL